MWGRAGTEGCPGSGLRGGRRGNFPECGTRLSAPSGGGAGGIVFPRPGGAELSSRAPCYGTGAPRALPGPACPCQDEWASVARSGRKRTSPARSAKRAGTRPGARPGLLVSWGRGEQAGVRTSTGAYRELQGPFPRLQIINGGSVCCNG